jgi:hypothetical protein
VCLVKGIYGPAYDQLALLFLEHYGKAFEVLPLEFDLVLVQRWILNFRNFYINLCTLTE